MRTQRKTLEIGDNLVLNFFQAENRYATVTLGLTRNDVLACLSFAAERERVMLMAA